MPITYRLRVCKIVGGFHITCMAWHGGTAVSHSTGGGPNPVIDHNFNSCWKTVNTFSILDNKNQVFPKNFEVFLLVSSFLPEICPFSDVTEPNCSVVSIFRTNPKVFIQFS